MSEKEKKNKSKSKNKNKSTKKIIISVAIIVGVLAAAAAFVFFVPITQNDCDPPCQRVGEESYCLTVCGRTYQTTWDIITNQKHVVHH